MARGTLVTIEGVDGAGKSTLALALSRTLAAGGRRVELLREPGGVQVSERIRDLLKDPSLKVGAPAEALLYAASRAQLVQERLLPLLGEGVFVLLDRFLDSSLAYQGVARGLGVEQVRSINLFATDGLVADRTLLLELPWATASGRAQTRAAPADRLEGEGGAFFETVAAAYHELALAEPQRIRRIDASQPAERVLSDAMDALDDLLTHHRSS